MFCTNIDCTNIDKYRLCDDDQQEGSKHVGILAL